MPAARLHGQKAMHVGRPQVFVYTVCHLVSRGLAKKKGSTTEKQCAEKTCPDPRSCSTVLIERGGKASCCTGTPFNCLAS